MLKLVASWLLLFSAVTTHSLEYESVFQLLPKGFRFVSTHSLEYQNNTNTLFFCLTTCLRNIRCRTINFDSSNHQCSLFTAWIHEGSLSSASSTTQIAYIPQQPSLYTSYLQPCVPSIHHLNRYLQCLNNTWICPDRYFFNGSVCERQRSFNQPCQDNQWCAASRRLTCSIFTNSCSCQVSTTRNGSQCVPLCPSGQSGITFENLAVSTPVPYGYGGFQWSNMEVCHGNGDLHACNRNSSQMSITRINGSFILHSLVVGIYGSRGNVTFIGRNMNTVVHSGQVDLNNTIFWILSFSWSRVDTVIIETSAYSHTPMMSIDDVCFTP